MAAAPVLHLAMHIHAKPGRKAELRAVLRALAAPSRADQGCLLYAPQLDRADPAHFFLYEAWTSRDLWQAHMPPTSSRTSRRAPELVADWTVHELDAI